MLEIIKRIGFNAGSTFSVPGFFGLTNSSQNYGGRWSLFEGAATPELHIFSFFSNPPQLINPDTEERCST